jgi:hypothetical protein
VQAVEKPFFLVEKCPLDGEQIPGKWGKKTRYFHGCGNWGRFPTGFPQGSETSDQGKPTDSDFFLRFHRPYYNDYIFKSSKIRKLAPGKFRPVDA